MHDQSLVNNAAEHDIEGLKDEALKRKEVDLSRDLNSTGRMAVWQRSMEPTGRRHVPLPVFTVDVIVQWRSRTDVFYLPRQSARKLAECM